MKKTRSIKVDVLARVEGEGSLFLEYEGQTPTQAQLRIFESPRFFEAFLRGRDFREAPDITARICGICPIAYQLGACQAMEAILGVSLPQGLQDLRRLIYCGEWIESHTLHVYMLHAPDFLGYPSALEMARDFPAIVQRGLRMKKAGNQIMQILGGREIHPINLRVGGFYRLPFREELRVLREELLWGRDAALETVRWVATFPFPDLVQSYRFLALSQGSLYPIDQGDLTTNFGLSFPKEALLDHIEETHLAHTNALQAHLKDHGTYLVGPLARFALHFDKLSPLAQDAAKAAGMTASCVNSFQSILVRSIEILYAFDEAIRLLDAYLPPDAPSVEIQPRAGVGHGCTEAPRGICYHRYAIDDQGLIQEARIIPPTSQNQRQIEEDLLHVAARYHDLPDEALTWRCEQTIRNYDPCISCATHFLRLRVRRLPSSPVAREV